MKVVTINSDRNIFVFGTSYTQNNGDEKTKVSLNSNTWLKTEILIEQGIHDYPAEIKEWDSVKALESARILTCGEVHEGVAKEQDEQAVNAKKQAVSLEKEEKIENTKKKMRKAKLDEIADKAVEKEYQNALKED